MVDTRVTTHPEKRAPVAEKAKDPAKIAAAKLNAKRVGKDIQRYGEAREVELVRRLGGVQAGDNGALDAVRKIGGVEHGIEVKAVVNQGGAYAGKQAKLSMKKDQVERKIAWKDAKEGREIHSIAFDHRDRAINEQGEHIGNQEGHSGHELYYRRGVGAFRSERHAPGEEHGRS